MKPYELMRRGFTIAAPVLLGWDGIVRSAQIGLSNSNRTATLSSPLKHYNTAIGAVQCSGKVYWETTYSRTGSGETIGAGVARNTMSATGNFGGNDYVGGRGGGSFNSCALWGSGTIVYNGTAISSISLPSDPLVIGFAFDVATGRLWIGNGYGGYVDGGDPATGSNATVTLPYSDVYPAFTACNNGQSITINEGDHAYQWTQPSGFVSLT